MSFSFWEVCYIASVAIVGGLGFGMLLEMRQEKEREEQRIQRMARLIRKKVGKEAANEFLAGVEAARKKEGE